MNLIKSRQRVADHGEVFTPRWLVEHMLDLVRGESERIDARFLEPACGSGNFLVPILQRKLASVEAKFATCAFERQHYALLGLMNCYGIELLADNITECRANMLTVFANHLDLADASDPAYCAAVHVLSLNLVHGDARTLHDSHGAPIRVPEWGYLGKGRFQRRDFRLSVLTGTAKSTGGGVQPEMFAPQQMLTPVAVYPPATLRDLADLARASAGVGI